MDKLELEFTWDISEDGIHVYIEDQSGRVVMEDVISFSEIAEACIEDAYAGLIGDWPEVANRFYDLSRSVRQPYVN